MDGLDLQDFKRVSFYNVIFTLPRGVRQNS